MRKKTREQIAKALEEEKKKSDSRAQRERFPKKGLREERFPTAGLREERFPTKGLGKEQRVKLSPSEQKLFGRRRPK